jgi:hypothetical protein
MYMSGESSTGEALQSVVPAEFPVERYPTVVISRAFRGAAVIVAVGAVKTAAVAYSPSSTNAKGA